MVNKPADDTLNEILAEDRSAYKKKRKGKGCFIRFLLIITLLIVFFFGFIYVQQYLLDLEAEAIVRAYQTATALSGSALENPVEQTIEPTSTSASEVVATETPEMPTSTATPDTDLARTATIAAQLTSVADFQSTVTSTP